MGNRLIMVASTVIGAALLAFTGSSMGSAQGSQPQVAPIVTINHGTCEQLDFATAYDLGPMELVKIWGDQDGEDGPAESVLTDDQKDQTGGEGAFSTDNEVWKAAGAIDGADGQQLVGEQNNSMVIHQSADQPDTILACGEILDMVQNGTVMVPLRAVGDSNYTGMGTIAGDSGDYSAFLLEGLTLTAPPEPTATAVPTETPVPTETAVPTETPVPPTNTPVQVTVVSSEVVTEVVTEVTTTDATQTPTAAS